MTIPAYSQSGPDSLTAAEVLPLTIAPDLVPGYTPSVNGVIVRIRPVQSFELDRLDTTLAGSPPSAAEVPAHLPNAFALITYPQDVEEDSNVQMFVSDGTVWTQTPIGNSPVRYEHTLPDPTTLPELSWVNFKNEVGPDGTHSCTDSNIIRINVPVSLQGETTAGQYVDITTYGESNTLQVIDGGWWHEPNADLPLIEFDSSNPQGN